MKEFSNNTKILYFYQDVILSATVLQTMYCTSVNSSMIKYGMVETCNKCVPFPW